MIAWWQLRPYHRATRRQRAFSRRERRWHHRALRARLHTWSRTASRLKAVAAENAMRVEHVLHSKSKLAVQKLEGEIVVLRRAVENATAERRASLSLEAEVGKLRKALDEGYGLNQKLQERASYLESQYRALWRATHDPAYIGTPSEELVPAAGLAGGVKAIVVPATTSRVEEVVQQHRRTEKEELRIAKLAIEQGFPTSPGGGVATGVTTPAAAPASDDGLLWGRAGRSRPDAALAAARVGSRVTSSASASSLGRAPAPVAASHAVGRGGSARHHSPSRQMRQRPGSPASPLLSSRSASSLARAQRDTFSWAPGPGR